jgi:signal transduction histidine kinase
MRHVLVAVLVVVVVNAQLTWWVIFVLRENRTRLELERDRMAAACREEAARVRVELDRAREVLADWKVSGEGYGSAGLWRWPPEPPPEPFETWADSTTLSGEPGWHRAGDGRLRLEYPGDHAMRGYITVSGWESALLAIGDGLELSPSDAVEPGAKARPAAPLPAPFDDLVVRPDAQVWSEVLDAYRRRILMMVSEGSFFAVLLMVIVALQWRTLRREAELERQHRNFLSAVTHELKSPLAAVRLSLETVLSGRAEGDSSERFLGHAMADANRLEGLVQKVLETTRYGHGGRPLELERVCVSDVVTETVGNFARSAEARGAHLEREIEGGIWAELDPEAFAIVISNLLENAVKYGGVEPRVGVRFWIEDGNAVLEATDNGPGIAADDVPFVFQRFYRSGDEMSRTTRGTGLGLYLVRQIVDAHRGTVEVRSTGPQGTTFRVTLPGAELKEGGP